MLAPVSRAKKGVENLLAGILGEKSDIRQCRKYLDETFGSKAKGWHVTTQAGRGSGSRSCSLNRLDTKEKFTVIFPSPCICSCFKILIQL